jgi:hypothetical protein
MKPLDEAVLDNELPEDTRVWVVIDKAEPGTYLNFPFDEKTMGVWAFLKREDAEHLIYLLKSLAPAYKDMELEATDDLLKDIREGARKHKGLFTVIPPNSSIKFFERYKEQLARYYGL